MKIRTQIDVPVFPKRILYNDHILSLGSCFATNMGDKLKKLKYPIDQNPCGITFNPASLLTTIKRLTKPDSLHEAEFQLNQGLWSHPDFHGSYNHPDLKTAHNKAYSSLKTAQKSLPQLRFVILTLGTNQVFRSKKTGLIVNNCHKIPADQFTKETLSVDQMVAALSQSIATLQTYNDQSIQFIISVSPIRHIKNGLVGDKYQKACCLIAAHEVTRQFDNAHYFPAYEIMMDDLRDYRYYTADMIHPSPVAIDYIFDLFEKSLLSEEEQPLRDKISNINARKDHKALFPESKNHQKFLVKLDQDIQQLKLDYPSLTGRQL